MAVKLMFLKRRPDFTHEQFVDYWTGPFADKFRKDSPWNQPNPNLLRYNQHILTPTEGWDFDGFSEQWYPSREAAEPVESSEYFRRSSPELQNFLDPAALVGVWAEPRVVVEYLGSGGDSVVSMLSFYKRRPDWTHEQYVDYWTGTYTDGWRKGPWAPPNPEVIRYVQHVLTPTEGWDYDGFSEVWFSNPAAVRSVLSSEFFQRTVPNLPLMIDPAACISVWEQQRVVAEHVGGDGAVTAGLPVQYRAGGGGVAN